MTDSVEKTQKKLWRYMPLTSLIDLLQSREIRMPSASSFADLKEGHLGLEILGKEVTRPLPPNSKDVVSGYNRETYVSCWHLSSSESLAMWKIYGGNNASVAIVSNTGKVMRLISDFCSDLSYLGMVGEVIYDRYVTDGKIRLSLLGVPFGYRDLNYPVGLQILFMKASAFSYEQEWRVILHRKGATDPAIRVPIPRIEEFIEAIYISPEAPEWLVSSIQQLVAVQFNLPSIKVSRSPLVEHYGI